MTAAARSARRLQRVAWVAGTALLALAAVAVAQNRDPQRDTEAARVGEIVVTVGDLDDAWQQNDASSRIRLLQQLYETRRRVLDIVVGEHLVEREARARGLTKRELLEAEVAPRVRPVTDAEIDRVYERNRDAFEGRTREEMGPEIRAAIEQQRPAEALHEFMRELRERADDVVVLLDPPRQAIDVLPDDPARGPADAAVVIVEFSDFQCPYCRRATQTLSELLERYDGKIRFVYKDYPLPRHTEAFKAAEAANCAHEQGRFWAFHDLLFARQDALDIESLKTYADELGLDANRFDQCLDEGRYRTQVQEDLQIGRRYGVSSTPTMFINGRAVMGAVPLATLDAIIQEELAAAGP